MMKDSSNKKSNAVIDGLMNEIGARVEEIENNVNQRLVDIFKDFSNMNIVSVKEGKQTEVELKPRFGRSIEEDIDEDLEDVYYSDQSFVSKIKIFISEVKSIISDEIRMRDIMKGAMGNIINEVDVIIVDKEKLRDELIKSQDDFKKLGFNYAKLKGEEVDEEDKVSIKIGNKNNAIAEPYNKLADAYKEDNKLFSKSFSEIAKITGIPYYVAMYTANKYKEFIKNGEPFSYGMAAKKKKENKKIAKLVKK